MFDPTSIPPLGTPISPLGTDTKKPHLDAMLTNAPVDVTLGMFF